MIITVAAIKGGVGKTTLSMGLTETLSRARPGKPALLLDLDPQGSAKGFSERTENIQSKVEAIKGRSVGQLSRLIREATEGEEFVVIDTPPGQIDITDAAIGESDFVLVPTEPYVDPLTQAMETIDMTSGVTPSAIVLNLVNPSANDAPSARKVLKERGTPVLDIDIPNWVAIARIDGSTWSTDQRVTSIFTKLAEKVLEHAK